MDSNITLPWLYSLGCNLITVGWVVYFWLVKDIHFEWLDALARPGSNLINLFLINWNITLCYFESLNVGEYQKFLICFFKVNTNLFSAAPVLSLISWVGPSPNTKNLFFSIIIMRWWAIINSKNYNIFSIVIIETSETFIKCYSSTIMI